MAQTEETPSKWENFKASARSAAKKSLDYFGHLSANDLAAYLLKIGHTFVTGSAALFKVIGKTVEEIGHVLGVLKPVIGGAIELHAAFTALTDKKTDLNEEEEKEPLYKRLARYVLYKREAWFRFFNIGCMGLILFGSAVPLLATLGISVAALPVLGAVAPFAIPVGVLLLCTSASLRYSCHFITAIWERYQINKKLQATTDPEVKKALNKELFNNTQKIYEAVGYSVAGVFGFAAAACTLTAAILVATGVGAPVAAGLGIAATVLTVVAGVTALGTLGSSKIGFPLYTYIKAKQAEKTETVSSPAQKLATENTFKASLTPASKKEDETISGEILEKTEKKEDKNVSEEILEKTEKKEDQHMSGKIVGNTEETVVANSKIISPFKKKPPTLSSVVSKKHKQVP